MDQLGNPADSLPLTETTFVILLSLANRPRHGYAILKDVEGISDGRITFSTGTLYGALRRLLKGGWIERVDGNRVEQPDDDRERKHYRLTQAGRRILEAETGRLKAMVRLAEQRGAGATA